MARIKKGKQQKKPTSRKKEKYALISVFDKSGIVDFAAQIHKLGYKIISTGGTYNILKEKDIPVIPIQEITGNPESFDGRMKSISFEVASGILFDRKKSSHRKQAKKLNIKPIDIVVCNLYPFEKTVQNDNQLEKAIENIDVGGPTMIRAAAKNFQNVLVVIDPKDYQMVSEKLQTRSVDNTLRQDLATKAFAHLSFYDAQIAKYLRPEQSFPQEITIAGRKLLDLRYGENPHQKAAIYLEPGEQSPFTHLQKLWGRDLSLINLTDINAGIETIRLLDRPAAVVIKHNNPCGIALGITQWQALDRAITADPESAFGGVIVLNRSMDLKTAKRIGLFRDEKRGNIDIIAVPSIDADALEFLKDVRKSMGVYTFGKPSKASENVMNMKSVIGGFILQTEDADSEDSFSQWTVPTKVKPTKKQLEQMKIAWLFITRIKSNAVIVVDKNVPMTRGIGTGQTSRVRSTKIALEQAGGSTEDAILASDSFFPFPDSVLLCAKYGIGAIVQQGGSINDKASIEAANKAKMPMVFTQRRAFWH